MCLYVYFGMCSRCWVLGTRQDLSASTQSLTFTNSYPLLLLSPTRPPVEGHFEVVVNGDLVWSKKTRGQGFPTTNEHVRVRTHMPADRQFGEYSESSTQYRHTHTHSLTHTHTRAHPHTRTHNKYIDTPMHPQHTCLVTG